VGQQLDLGRRSGPGVAAWCEQSGLVAIVDRGGIFGTLQGIRQRLENQDASGVGTGRRARVDVDREHVLGHSGTDVGTGGQIRPPVRDHGGVGAGVVEAVDDDDLERFDGLNGSETPKKPAPAKKAAAKAAGRQPTPRK
jgi:hypothetical protein